MVDRRILIAATFATLLVAGALVLPQTFTAEGALESTATLDNPVTAAIENGGANSLVGLLPTSEAYQRATEVIDGLQAGVPASPPSLNAAQLSDVSAIAAGAAQGALAVAPNTLTSQADKDALHSLAEGYMEGALDEIASAPSAARAAVDQAAAKGVFAAAMTSIFTDGPAMLPSEYEEFGALLSGGLFEGLDEQGATLGALAGSPALGDITLFTTTHLRSLLGTLPQDATSAQIDAAATFAAGALDGMIAGVVTSFPQGAPGPTRNDVERWFDALGYGHRGTPPWEEPGSLGLLLAWADAVGAAGVTSIDAARETLTGEAPPGAAEELAALATGLAQGAFTYLQDTDADPNLQDDVQAYAKGLTQPGIEAIFTVVHPPSDPDAITAYVTGATGGLADLAGASAAALGLTQAWLDGLTAAITDFPLGGDVQLLVLQNFAEGLTTSLTMRMENITRATTGDLDTTFLTATAAALSAGATELASDDPLADPELAEAFGDGLSSGFLETRDPQALFDDALMIMEFALAWDTAAMVPSVLAVKQMATSAAADPWTSVSELGRVITGAPLEWATTRGSAIENEAWHAGVEDTIWLSAFAATTIGELSDSLSIDPTNPKPLAAVRAVREYADAVLGAAVPSTNVWKVVRSLQHGELRAHANAFAAYLMVPADWVETHPDGGTIQLAKTAALSTLGHAQAIERFTEPEFAAAAIVYLEAMGEGLSEDPGAYADAWIGGTMDAIMLLPSDAVEGDISSRIVWARSAASVVGPIRKEITTDQKEAATAYATAAASWALGAGDHLPSGDELDLPLTTWADGTIAAALEHLPPVMSDAERDAVVAYLTGIATAVESVPVDEMRDPLTDAAVLAYLTGITSGVDGIPEETNTFLCYHKVKVGDCPERPPDDDEEEEEENCPSGDCPPPPEPVCAEDVCSFTAYTERLSAWANGLVDAGLESYTPDVTPTRDGVALVKDWAFLVLGGHGLCPDVGDVAFDCGPRPPVVDFAEVSYDRIDLTTELIADGFRSLVTYDPSTDRPLPVDPEDNALLSWSSGLTSGITSFVTGEYELLPSGSEEDDGPSATPPLDGDLMDAAYREALHAWVQGVWDAPDAIASTIFRPLPETEGLDTALGDFDHLLANVILQGGAAAIGEDGVALIQYAREPVPRGSLDAWALGLVTSAQGAALDPTATDAQLLLDWYAGLANGGVGAILAAGSSITDGQAAGLAAYAEAMGAAFTPPAPPESYTLADLRAPRDTEKPAPGEGPSGGTGSGGNGGNEQGPGANAFAVYRAQLQAHAEGMAAAALAAPVDPAPMQLYLDRIVAAAQALPPVQPGEGYPARLSAWTDAETRGALGSPPTSPERVGIAPDLEFALAFVQAFAESIPWAVSEASDGKEEWATSTILAATQTPCPDPARATCVQLGATLGDALGQGIPQSGEEIPLPPTDDQIAFVQAILSGAGPALPATPAGPAAQIVLGIVAGAVPDGIDSPQMEDVAAAVAAALASDEEPIPAVALRRTAEELTAALLRTDPEAWKGRIDGALAIAQSQKEDPLAMQQAMAEYLTASGGAAAEPVISVTDGVRTKVGAQIHAGVYFDAQVPLTITAYPAGSSPISSTWELRWDASDPMAPRATGVAMSGENGVFRATITPARLADLPRASSVLFVVVEKDGARTTIHSLEGDPFAFTPDRDAPGAVATATTPATAHIPVAWSGSDGDSRVVNFRIDAKDGEGPWNAWLSSTAETGATFSGTPGHVYTFRATAIDAVGHESEPGVSASVTVPGDATPNRAPTVAVLAPIAESAFGRTIPVQLQASDPDGTIPMVKVCLRRDNAALDLSCPYEGKPEGISLETIRFPDGRYRLHVTATDGTLIADTLSATFAIDRSPPTFRGAGADASTGRVVFSASLNPDATVVVADIDGRAVPLADDGKAADERANDGIWTAVSSLVPGEYAITFRATDGRGNEATLVKSVLVPARIPSSPPVAPGTGVGTDGASPPSEGAAPPPASDEDGAKKTPPMPVSLVLVALGLLALARRRRA